MEFTLTGRSFRVAGFRRARELRNDPRDAKKNKLKPWLKEYWCIPSTLSGEYVYHLEDVLEVYKRPFDARFPLICMDETSKQMRAEIYDPLPMKPGFVKKVDYQ